MTKLKCSKSRIFGGEKYKFFQRTKYKNFAKEMAEKHRKAHPNNKARMVYCESDKAWYVYVK